MTTNELNEKGCYHLACAVIAQAFQPAPVRPKQSFSMSDKDYKIKYDEWVRNVKTSKEIRIDFAKHSPLIEKLADCSDALLAKTIRNKIIEFNT